MTDDNSALDGGPRREVSAATLTAREARLMVAPVNQKMGVWQATTIKLETIAKRLKSTGRHDPSVAEATRTLLDFVVAQAAELETIVANAPEAVQVHGRISDTRQGLQSLEKRLTLTLAELGETPGKR